MSRKHNTNVASNQKSAHNNGFKQSTEDRPSEFRREASIEKSDSDSSDVETPSQHEEIPYPDLDSSDNERTPEIEIRTKSTKVLVPEAPFIPKSPILYPHERKQAKELGYSLDTKLLNDEFFFIDLEKMCYCLAIAIQRQIHFSRGFLFLDDLAAYLKRGGNDENIIDPDDLTHSENELRFSYQFPDHLKLTQMDQYRSGDRSSEETCNIKRALDMDEEHKRCIFPDINGHPDSIENLEAFLQKEGYSKYSERPSLVSNESPMRLKSLLNSQNNHSIDSHQSRDNKYCNPSYHSDQEDDIEYEQDSKNLNVKNDPKYPSKHQNSNYLEQFNLPSIVNTRKPRIETDETGEFYEDESRSAISPNKPSQNRIRGLHDYEGNKENIGQNESPIHRKGGQVAIAIKPRPLESSSNELVLNLAPTSIESPYNPNNSQSPGPVDDESPLEASSLFESVYEMGTDSNQIKRHIKECMQKYDITYDIETEENLVLSPSEKEMIYNPQFADIFEYVKYVTFKSKMEAEIPIISLIYIEKLLRKCGVLVNVHNWRRVVLITLCIGSKIWDDDSLENVHFPKVMPDVTVKDISTLEKTFLDLIEYDVIIKCKEYAKYYFIMTTLGEESKKNPPWRLMNPSNVQKIEGESHRIQEQLKKRYGEN